MKLLVIIVTFNGMKWLSQCLSSVKCSSVKADLFIVDNGSTDGSIEYIKENYPESIFIESKENLGFGKANNMGLKYAIENNYDYVYLLNQDAWVEKDTFRQLIETQRENPEYGILSPLQMNNDKTKLDSSFLALSCKDNLISDSLSGQILNSIYETDFVMAAHWLIPILTVKQVGGFSPIFSQYAEDDNFIDRTHYWGYKVGIVPKALGIHDRENRTTSIDKKIHIATMHWRRDISNPLESKKNKLKKVTLSVSYFFLKHPLKILRKCIVLCQDLNSIIKDYNLSKKKGAFLYLKSNPYK